MNTIRRIPRGFLGMVALVFLVEGLIGGQGKIFRHSWAWDWYIADRAARTEARECQVLCFGDSLMKFGVSPQLIESGSGCKTYNFGVIGGLPASSFFLFRRAIEAGARPRAVVIEAIPHSIAAEPEANARLWPDLLSYRDCLELCAVHGDSNFFASMLLAKTFPSIRDRLEIRNALKAALNGQPSPLGDFLQPYLRNWALNRGAQMMRRPPTAPPDDIAPLAPWLVPPSWKPTALTSRYLREFCRLAASKGIRVYWLLPPMSPEVQRLREISGRDAEYVGFVKSIQAEYPQVVVLDARHSGYGPETLQDLMHLEMRGAVAISRDLAAILRRDPASLSNWEIMPKFRDLPAEVALEDVGKSMEAVAAMRRR